ncbi:MAG: MATE family efflux transporter [Paracoccaceae bacterium]|jgi:MATE family multidrug resistance protein
MAILALTKIHHLKSILALGLPIAGSFLAQNLLHVTDTVMMGWYGVTELAAVVLGSSTFFILFILGSGFGQAVMPMVAQAVGRGDQTQVRRDTRMGLWLSFLYGLISYPVFWYSGTILHYLGQADDVAMFAQDYLRLAGLGMIPALGVMVIKSYLGGLGRVKVALWITVAAVFVNVIFNYVLVFGVWGAPEMGVRGAAIASVIVQSFSIIGLGLYAALQADLRNFSLFQRFWRPDWPAFFRVFNLGWPIGTAGLAEGGMFQAAALMMGWIGTVQLAAHGIALEVASLSFMVHLGLSNAATIRVGRMMGENDPSGLRDVAFMAFLLSSLFAGLVIWVFLLWPEQILNLFLDRSDPQTTAIVQFGLGFLAVAAIFQFVDAMQVMAMGLLRGLQDTKIPMLLAVMSYWLVGIPASYLLAFKMGMDGIGLWLGLAIGLSVAAVALIWRFWLRGPKGFS